MTIKKLMLAITFILVIILLGGLLNLKPGYLDKIDIIIISICSLVIAYFNNLFSEKKVFLSFIFFYFYTICYLLPVIYFAYYPELLILNFEKYIYIPNSFANIFIFTTLSIVLTQLICIFIPFSSMKTRYISLQILTKNNIIIGIVFLILNYIINQIASISVFIIFFNVNAIAFIVIVGIANQKTIDKNIKPYLFIFFTIIILMSIFGGIRSGITTILFNTILLLMFFKGNIFIEKKHLLYLMVIGILAIFSYPIATFFRVAKDLGVNTSSISLDSIIEFNAANSVVNPFSYMFYRIIQRISLLEFSFVMSNNLYDPRFFTENLTFLNELKSTINLILPGTYFDVLDSNNYLINLTNNKTVNEIRNDWSSYNISFFYFNILQFGKYLGFIFTFLFFFLYISLLNFLLKKKKIILKMISIYLVISVITIFIFFGYDYFIRNAIHFLLATVVYLYLFKKKFKFSLISLFQQLSENRRRSTD